MDLITTSSGAQLHRYADFQSAHVAPRHVEVWLPPGHARGEGRYPVIYMHDGQNLFDPATAFIGVDWAIDRAMTGLIEQGLTAGAIVVGIWNTERRRREYMPEQALSSPAGRTVLAELSRANGGPPLSDAYLRMLVLEVKPLIDAGYRTLPDRAHTFVMGSSMGGLVSLYALCQYPEMFGGAACVSTHWPIGGSLLVEAMATALPPPGAHRLYFDYGTATLDAGYEPYQRQMDRLLLEAGYEQGRDCLTRKFPGAEHSERAWRERAAIPLGFLLAPAPPAPTSTTG
jgi:predicted alpha/beta superfamily hydrolase